MFEPSPHVHIHNHTHTQFSAWWKWTEAYLLATCSSMLWILWHKKHCWSRIPCEAMMKKLYQLDDLWISARTPFLTFYNFSWAICKLRFTSKIILFPPSACLCPAHISTTLADSVGSRAENTLWAPGSSSSWPEGAGVRVKWGLAPGGEILGTSLTYFESWSLYLKRGNKENLPHRLLWGWI